MHMSEEIPEANRSLTPAENSAVVKLSDADLQVIDDAILTNCAQKWLKVARVVTLTEDALKGRYPDLSYIFYSQRLIHLAAEGHLESQGNLEHIRFSEVRIQASPTPKKL
jgi:hypothetical protein